ncbi:MAG: Cell division protein FtsL [Anaerolineales bacterium]|nr:Cell division protein FtsL [Anaerolineales bacterium]
MPAQLQTLSLSRLSRLRRQELVERNVLRLICLGLVAVSLAGLLYLTQASAATTLYYEIQELRQDKERLQRTRDRLRGDVAALTAPKRVKSLAQDLGFQSTPHTEFLPGIKTPVVVQQPPPTVPADSPPAIERLLARTSGWLQGALSVLPPPQQVEAGLAD